MLGQCKQCVFYEKKIKEESVKWSYQNVFIWMMGYFRSDEGPICWQSKLINQSKTLDVWTNLRNEWTNISYFANDVCVVLSHFLDKLISCFIFRLDNIQLHHCSLLTNIIITNNWQKWQKKLVIHSVRQSLQGC